MTLKEKVAMEEPDKCSSENWGGVEGCPSCYSYLPRNMDKCYKCNNASPVNCTLCWNQEMHVNWVKGTSEEKNNTDVDTEEKKNAELDTSGRIVDQIAFFETLIRNCSNLVTENEALKAAVKDEMTANEYQALAMRTCPIELRVPDCERSIVHGVIGLNGEAGEAIDILKKAMFQGHDLDTEHLAKELGDVAWYLAVTANAIGYSLEDIFKINIEKLKTRYPDGFDTEKSTNRAEDDI